MSCPPHNLSESGEKTRQRDRRLSNQMPTLPPSTFALSISRCRFESPRRRASWAVTDGKSK
jgi:hypothetical protein